MKAVMVTAAAAAAMLGGSAALAQDPVVVVASTEQASAVAPRDGGAVIELANAYWQAGRQAEARDGYRRALALDNVMLETRSGDPIWSHQVARHMLASNVELSSR